MLLHHKIIQTAKRRSKHLAVKDVFRNIRLSYRKLLIASLMFSRRLKKIEDSYIGIMLPTSAGAIISIIAAYFAGKIPVMINYTTGAKDNIIFAQHKCGFKAVITSRQLLVNIKCPETDGMLFAEDMLESLKPWEKLLAGIKSILPAWLLYRFVASGNEKDTALILFTSGSEREPKGVELSHYNIFSDFTASVEVIDFNQNHLMLAVLPFFHVFGFSAALWMPLAMGMGIITYPNPLDFKNIAKIVRDEKPDILIATPYFLMNYLKQSQPGDMSSLKFLIAGGDKVPDWLHDIFLEQQSIELLEGYGTTETSPVISVNTPGNNKRGSVGRPLPGVEVKIIDVATGQELSTGEEGKILVRGNIVMKGYFDDLEETALKIENGWYETGDMGFLDDEGFLWHCGRLKRFVKIAGEMISLVGIEDALLRHLQPGVDVCVVELPDAKKGAEIVAAVTGDFDEQEIKSILRKTLPPLAIPRHFVVVEELPKMGSGKIDFRSTTKMVQDLLL